MIGGVVLGLVAVVLLIVWRRRRRANNLAGLNSDKPAFSIEPPRRRLHRTSKETLR